MSAADSVAHDAAAVFAHRCPTTVRVEVERQVGSTADIVWWCGSQRTSATFVRWYGTWWYTPQDVTSGIDLTVASPQTLLAPSDTATDGYDLHLTLLSTQAGAKVRVIARMPTEAESWASPGGNGEFFLSLENLENAPLVTSGGELRVCYPFVARTDRAHTLTLAPASPNVGPITGTLRDNCLHFDLPPFSIPRKAESFGEVDFS